MKKGRAMAVGACVAGVLLLSGGAAAAAKLVFAHHFGADQMALLKPIFEEFATKHGVEWEFIQVPSDQLIEKVSV